MNKNILRRSLLTFLMIVMAVGLQSNEIGVTTLRNNAMRGLNVESGYEQEMAAWAYYCINGADGIAKDYNEAVRILKELVVRDESRVNSEKFHYVVEGYNLLGDCYEKGYGVTKDINKAKEYWQQAANYNHADAQAKIEMYPIDIDKPAPEQIFTAVEQKAVYPGGDAALLQWISLNIQYPTMAQEEGIEGRVFVKFVVEKDGSIGKVEVSRGKQKDLDAEAVRVVKKIPKKFTPAKQNGQAVRSWFTLPVTFKLAGKGSNDVTTTVNGVSFKMINVEGGTFRMGSNDSEADSDEKPVHSVTLSDYYIGETEVTQELWEAVMGSNPSGFKEPKNPVEIVSWDDCQEFIKKLNELTGKNFRLPTEAEWEYAARGGNKSRGYKYSGSDNIGDVAWYWDNSSKEPHPVGTKSPNELGIYDMSGNVWEWCSDWYGDYSSSSQTNPTGPATGSYRVNRGGSWYYSARICRVADRYSYTPGYRYNFLGFRLVCSRL